MGSEEQTAPTAQTAAAIDIGSNSLRMAVAQVHPDGETEVLERMSRPVRLGQDTFVSGKISPETTAAAAVILRDFRQVLEGYGVELVRAVATSAVREATNRDAFVDRIAVATGLEVEVIEPAEQSMLIVSAVRHAVGDGVDLGKRMAMIVEVGGGSTLLTLLRRGEILSSESFNTGSIRMQEILATAQEPPDRAVALMRQHIAGAVGLTGRSVGLNAVRTFVAIGGDARFAAQHAGQPVPLADLHRVPVAALDALVEGCAGHSAEELVRRYGLAFTDAETLVPALLVYQALLHATRAKEMIVSQVSMRDGLLLDMPRLVTGEQDPELTESIILSARGIGAKYQYDAEHAEQVALLSAQLFDQLQKEHGLSPRHRLLLRVAGLVHDVGAFVSSRAHHKHSFYLVSNAAIFGLRRQDIAIVAQVSRYHRRSVPKRSHLPYTALPHDQRMVVNKLAAILRVADALDRGHCQQVREFTAEVQGRELVIYVRGARDLTLERRALVDKGNMFRDIFGLKVRLEEDAAPAA